MTQDFLNPLGCPLQPVIAQGATLTTSHDFRDRPLDLSDNAAVRRFAAEREQAIRAMMVELTPESVLEKLAQGFGHIEKYVRGYEQTILQTQLALLTGNHHILIGPTGSGKTIYARAVMGLLGSGVLTFQDQFTDETDEGRLFGLIPLKKVEDGSGCRNLEGSLVLADVALLDEVFDARDALLRSLLWPLSDRQYRNGNGVVPAIVHSVIACGNYARRNERTAAFLDRFLFQTEVGRNHSPVDRQFILGDFSTNREVPVLPVEERISVAELRYISAVIDGKIPSQRVVIPREVLMLLDAVVTEYDNRRAAAREGDRNASDGDVSERNLKQLARVVAAHALLGGRREARVDDLSALACAVPLVGSEAAFGVFHESFKSVMRHGTSPAEQNVLRTLWDLTCMLEQVGDGLALRALTLPEQVFAYFGWTSSSKVSYGELKDAIGKLNPALDYARAYQRDLIARVDGAMSERRRGGDDPVWPRS